MASPLELKTDADFIWFLTETYGWQVEGPSYITIPSAKPEYITGNERELELIVHYLTQTYVIRDQFGTEHEARRSFLQELEQTNPGVRQWIDQHNKLRGTRIMTEVQLPLFLIAEAAAKPFPDVGQRLADIYRSHPFLSGPGYDRLQFDDKVNYVRKVDALAYRFLEELAR